MAGMDLTHQTTLKLNHLDHSQLRMYHNVFKNFPDGIITIDHTGKIIDFNNQITHMFGYDASDLSLQPFDQFLVDNFRDTTKDYFYKVLNGRSVKHYSKVLHKTGYEVPVKITSTPIYENNEVIGLFTIVHDLIETERNLIDLSSIKDKLVSAQAVANIGTWEVDIPNNQIHWSDPVYKIYDREEWKKQPLDLEKILSVTHQKDYHRFKTALEEAIEYGTSFQMDYRVMTEDDDVRILHVRGDSIINKNGGVTRLIGIVQDVTKLRNMEYSLEANHERLQKIYDSLDMIVCSFNLDNKRLDYVSKGIERMINVNVEHVYHSDFNWTSYIHPADLKRFSRNRRKMLRGDKVKHEYRIISRDSEIKWVEEQAIPIFDQEGRISQIDGILIDFTERKLYEQQMEFITNHDHLTGLKNRRNFESHINNLLSQKKLHPFWLIYLDLDNFKSINDSLGHDIGDKVLVMTGSKIESIVEERGIASRLNGDEFIIMINKLRDGETIDDIAIRLKASLERKMVIEEYPLQVTSSIGVTHYPEHGSNLNELINNADRAVRYIKGTGKNSWQIFEENVEKRTFNDYELEQDLYFAVENNELDVYLQPIMKKDSPQTSYAEALVRWKHPVHGLIPPSAFIPIAEQSGFIHQIDEFVFKRTCEIIQRWKMDYQIDLTVSNNVSPKRFLRHSFITNVKNTLNHFQVDARNIIFEITETTLIHDPEIVHKTINDFRKLGIRFALDDFGTGYSSISHVSMFNIDFLKIDRQFIQDIHLNKRNQAILKGITNFTSELNIPMIAEGIETAEELEFLQKLNCAYFQGYYFSKPCDLETFKEFMLG
ncbi:phosphodiesterase [Filobacillus milosensis]|uniref:Phosphodiesterase n=1 Tax=Filobacillus milosensis TaxID=94137 RepID=A0A4Y8IF97_9BACI|nr:GGDEF domain-containing phosphodiesterase [Filobacillus milosensis]TFB18879.1 phosphodiesterase [Filobacillus milosensis]